MNDRGGFKRWLKDMVSTQRKIDRVAAKMAKETSREKMSLLNEKHGHLEGDIIVLLNEAGEDRARWGYGK
jgi:ferritin-like metal-binding protein YciE